MFKIIFEVQVLINNVYVECFILRSSANVRG
jgi:hypothetical protein